MPAWHSSVTRHLHRLSPAAALPCGPAPLPVSGSSAAAGVLLLLLLLLKSCHSGQLVVRCRPMIPPAVLVTPPSSRGPSQQAPTATHHLRQLSGAVQHAAVHSSPPCASGMTTPGCLWRLAQCQKRSSLWQMKQQEKQQRQQQRKRQQQQHISGQVAG